MKEFDILALDAVGDHERGFDCEMKFPDGEKIGVVFTIIGTYSKAVQDYSMKLFTEYHKKKELNSANVEKTEAEANKEIAEQNKQGAMVRVIGWKGANAPFTKENLSIVLDKNPYLVNQILRESDVFANFTKAL
jgi:hypothetical protein